MKESVMAYSTAFFFVEGKSCGMTHITTTDLWWREGPANEGLSNQLSVCAYNNISEESHARIIMQHVELLVVKYVIF